MAVSKPLPLPASLAQFPCSRKFSCGSTAYDASYAATWLAAPLMVEHGGSTASNRPAVVAADVARIRLLTSPVQLPSLLLLLLLLLVPEAHLEADVLPFSITIQPQHQPSALPGKLLQVLLQWCLVLQAAGQEHSAA
jgi:hypothetical protein